MTYDPILAEPRLLNPPLAHARNFARLACTEGSLSCDSLLFNNSFEELSFVTQLNVFKELIMVYTHYGVHARLLASMLLCGHWSPRAKTIHMRNNLPCASGPQANWKMLSSKQKNMADDSGMTVRYNMEDKTTMCGYCKSWSNSRHPDRGNHDTSLQKIWDRPSGSRKLHQQ